MSPRSFLSGGAKTAEPQKIVVVDDDQDIREIMDGRDICKSLKQQAATSAIPAVIVSASHAGIRA